MAGPLLHRIRAALAAPIALRNLALALIFAFALPSIGAAQGVQPFPEDQGGLWETALNVSGGPPAAAYAGSPDAACRIQHQEFNPGATYLPPNYVDADSYNCNWDQVSGPAPGSIRFVCGPGFSPVDGKCLYLPAQSVECACEPGGKAQSAPDTPTVGNPISITSGYKVIAERDYESADGLLAVDRSFVSRPGDGWKLLMPGYLVVEVGSTAIAFHSIAGGYDDFVPTDGNPATWTYTQPNFFGDPLSTSRHRLSMVTTPTVDRPSYFADTNVDETDPAEVRLDKANGEYILFRRVNISTPTSGQRILVPVEAGQPGGYTRWFDYADDGPFPYRVRDSFNRALLLEWDDTDGSNVSMPFRLTKAISKITLPDGTRLEYDYDRGGSDFIAPVPTWAITAGLDVRGVTSSNMNFAIDAPKDRLRSVTRRSAANAIAWKRSYDYQNGFQPNNLTAIRDQNNVVRASYTYAGFGKLASSQRAGGVAPYSYEHLEVLVAGSPDNRQQVRRVTGPLGRRDDYLLYRRENAARIEPWAITSIEGQATATTPADSRSFAYDSSFGIELLKSGMTDARGTLTSYSNDLAKGRPTAIAEAVGTAEERSTTILWHATLDLPTQVDVPGLRTNYIYDASGQLLTRTLTDTTTHTLPYVTAGQTRSETYTWGAGGRLASVNGPRAAVGLQDDITGFTYDAAGNLLTMTDALGHVTTFASYDANGRPGSMTDPNGAVTLFAYDALGRLVSTNRKDPASPTLDAITAYEYDVEGRVTGITLPGTQKMIFGYNLAGQLLQVSSADGEKWRVQRDAMGNITQEKIKTSAGTDRSTITRSFDSLGRMLTETLGPGRTTAWEYDKNGNPVRTTSPRSHATDMAFDPLNRLIATLAPDSGTTATGYDANDDIAAFTDAASVQTTFVRNGFGEVIRETSPDRGTSVYEYDAAGNLTKATDGRGQVIDYSYDILNRLTQKTPAGRPASEIVSYSYDSNTLGACWCVGRLASITDGTGTTRFGYDHRGNLVNKTQPVGKMTWRHDLADRIVELRLSGGRFVDYARDDKGRVVSVQTRATVSATPVVLASNIVYEPLGPMKSADLGNGLKLALDWGTDRRLASKRLYTAAGVDVWHVAYGYDADDNIVAITDLVNPANSLTYGYDAVDRLTRMDGTAGAFARQDFLHDANGNRTAVERRTNIGDLSPAETDSFTKSSGTNRLASVTMPAGTRGFTHDARGNLTGEALPGGGTVTLAYDGHARLTAYAATGAPSQAMAYNGLDERTRITTTPSGGGAADTRHFLYDQYHRLTGEYGATVTDRRAEHIWLHPEVGGASPFGGDDGLGGYMPLALLTTAGGATAIHWVQGNHLGTPVAVTDASGAVVTPSGYSMPGFPGQVRQHAELYYNYYRDYDVSLGRYVQADPVGLEGDANPYEYAGENPLAGIDPLGLQSASTAPDPAAVAWEAGAKHYARNLVRPSRKIPVVGQALLIGDTLGTLAGIAWYGYINPPIVCRDGGGRGGARANSGGRSEPNDYCYTERRKEESYCFRKYGVVRWQRDACLERAFYNFGLCLKGESGRYWRDVDMDGKNLPKPPKKKRRWR